MKLWCLHMLWRWILHILHSSSNCSATLSQLCLRVLRVSEGIFISKLNYLQAPHLHDLWDEICIILGTRGPISWRKSGRVIPTTITHCRSYGDEKTHGSVIQLVVIKSGLDGLFSVNFSFTNEKRLSHRDTDKGFTHWFFSSEDQQTPVKAPVWLSLLAWSSWINEVQVQE